MPYSQRIVSDRQAVANFKYNARRLVKAVAADLSAEHLTMLKERIQAVYEVLDDCNDFYDDGTPMGSSTDAHWKEQQL